MTHIRHIFNADAIELHDLRADPNTVIKIQGLVNEMLEANDNRRLGIFKTILEEYKTFALPGVISATYVLSDQLTSKKRQQMIVDLLVKLCQGNVAAQRLLLRSGIIDSPFEVSREIALSALIALDDFDPSNDAQWLLNEAKRLAKDEDRHGATVIFELLLKVGVGISEALNVCYKWFASEFEASAPVRLMRLLLMYQPDQTEKILTKLFDALERSDTEAGQLIRAEVDLAGPDAIIPALISSSKRLDRERSGRAKPVELLFEGAIARQIVQSPSYIPICASFIKEQHLHDQVSRYWWQALSSAVKLGSQDARHYFERELAQMNDETYEIWGYVQLLFLRDAHRAEKPIRAWAQQTLQDLKILNHSLYKEAEEIRDRIVSANAISGKTRKRTGDAGIT